MRDHVADHVADRLLDQFGGGPHQRQIGRLRHFDLMRRAAPPRCACHPVDDLAQIDPVAPQFQCDSRQIESHAF
jgi:hypothetical protein